MILLLAAVLAVLSPQLPRIADPPAPASFFEDIVGGWNGEGQLLGRRATFTMIWEWELDDRFVRLTYSIRGDSSMDAVAHYRLRDGGSLDGVWVDSRGEILQLTATLTDMVLETHWRSPTEEGRTTYERTGPDSLEVRDYYHDGTDWQPFGQAQYERASGG